MSDTQLVIVSNRGPVSFGLADDGTTIRRHGSGGLAPSLATALSGSGATWLAAAMTDGDRAVAGSSEPVDVDGIDVRLLDVPLDVQHAAYSVVANGTLWFMQHGLFELARRPSFDRRWFDAWDAYRTYNGLFAKAVLEYAGESAVVLVHDYHLALCGAAFSGRGDLRSEYFTHTPWCDPHELEVLPDAVRRELVAGVCSYGAAGFHTERWAGSFRASAGELGRDPSVHVAPLGPDAEGLSALASSSECESHRLAWRELVGDRKVILRSDRIELSKNIARGFQCYDAFLEASPEWRGRVVFLALAYGSREDLPEYLAYRIEIEHLVARINERWGSDGWTPILLEVADDYNASVAALTLYDVLMVNPVRDGLNLVAKEGPLVNRQDGVVILSPGAGSFAELGEAVVPIHPYDIAGGAQAIAEALGMEAPERARRAAELRKLAAANSPHSWLGELVSHALPHNTTG